uniref:Uncharacterized protein n=1 Tax=Anguilla anguilla TaxID=7936 RepID=A0A0E9T7N5_ANGAN
MREYQFCQIYRLDNYPPLPTRCHFDEWGRAIITEKSTTFELETVKPTVSPKDVRVSSLRSETFSVLNRVLTERI